MNIELEEILNNKKEILERLMQLYLHNISLDFPIELNSQTALYDYDLEPYFNNPNYKAYFIKNNNELTGFVLINLEKNQNVVQELFILNNYKRKGIGRIVINKVFTKFKGNWIVRVLPCSLKAEQFWINVIKDYTKDNFNLEYVGKYKRAILTFNNENKKSLGSF